MMKQVFRLAVCVIGLTAMASQASAQALPWEGRGFINVNFGLQVGSDSTASSSTTSEVYGETATFTTAQSFDSQVPFFDIGGGIRVAGNFGIGFSYTRASANGSVTVDASIPSPIYYDKPRAVNAQVDDLDHIEDGYHFQLVWMLPVTDRFDVVFSGGPSVFNLKQGVLTEYSYSEVGSPWTTVNLTASQTTATGSQLGFNVGADLTFRFANNVGVGAMMRYTAATVSVEPPGGTALDVKVGGFQIGGGLRLRF